MRRAAVSIPANIAEGFRRRGKADKARYMNMAEASLEESRYYLILAKDLGYGDTSSLTNFTGRSQPLAQRLCVCHSGFGLLTPDFHIPQGYQGRSPCLVGIPTLLVTVAALGALENLVATEPLRRMVAPAVQFILVFWYFGIAL